MAAPASLRGVRSDDHDRTAPRHTSKTSLSMPELLQRNMFTTIGKLPGSILRRVTPRIVNADGDVMAPEIAFLMKASEHRHEPHPHDPDPHRGPRDDRCRLLLRLPTPAAQPELPARPRVARHGRVGGECAVSRRDLRRSREFQLPPHGVLRRLLPLVSA